MEERCRHGNMALGLSDMLTGRSSIGIKRMGALDHKPFFAACKKKFLGEEAGVKSMELCSLWEEHIRSPEWHPFKNINVGEKIMVLKDFSRGRCSVGVKRLGVVDEKPFKDVFRKKYPHAEANVRAAEMCSSWQEVVNYASWHPFKMTTSDGKLQGRTFFLFPLNGYSSIYLILNFLINQLTTVWITRCELIWSHSARGGEDIC